MPRHYKQNPIPHEQYDMTHEQIAAALGVKTTAIYQAERDALRKCRRICNARGIQFEAFFDSFRRSLQ